MSAFDSQQSSQNQGNKGGMPNIEADVQDIYGYRNAGGAIVWRENTPDDVWKTHLYTLMFHRLSVETYRYSLDDGKAYELHRERLNKENAAKQRAVSEAELETPLPAPMRRAREAALGYVSNELLQGKHYPFLKSVCKKMQLETRGTKDELIERIMKAQASGIQVPIEHEASVLA